MTVRSRAPASLRSGSTDPTKHVDYQLGMVLAPRFRQEFAYVAGHGDGRSREPDRYGTAWGLRIGTGPGANGPEVRVSSGAAVPHARPGAGARGARAVRLDRRLARRA